MFARLSNASMYGFLTVEWLGQAVNLDGLQTLQVALRQVVGTRFEEFGEILSNVIDHEGNCFALQRIR